MKKLYQHFDGIISKLSRPIDQLMERGKNHLYNRATNNALVLKYIKEHGYASATRLAQEFSLSNTALSLILKHLEEKGVIRETKKGFGRGKGRRQINYMLNSRFGIIAFINIEFGAYELSLSSIKEETLVRERFEVDHYSESTFEDITEEITRLGKFAEVEGVPLRQVVISVPGLVNIHDNSLNSYLFGNDFNDGKKWIDKLKKKFHMAEVYLGNDMNLAMCGEIRNGCAKGKGSALLLANESTIGGAICVDNKLFVGEEGYAGEFGDVPAFFEGRMIPLFYFASIQGLEYHFKTKGFESILKLYNEDEKAKEYIISTAKSLGETVYSIARLLNISNIIISGKATLFGEDYLDAIKSKFDNEQYPVDLLVSDLGNEAVTVGAISQGAAALLDKEAKEVW